jgi:large subunit ribosomal protein L24
MAKTKLRKGDRVRVMSGRNKGAEGRILAILRNGEQVIIEGVNLIRRTLKPTQQNPRGGFTDQEAPIHATNVQLLDPQTGEPSRIGYTFLETGEKVRVSRKSGAQLVD